MSKFRKSGISADEILSRLWDEEQISDLSMPEESEEEEEEETIDRVYEVDVLVQDLPFSERLVIRFIFILKTAQGSSHLPVHM
jgi:hypothetical protein